MIITFIPSDNGLGHIKRLVTLANFLSKFFRVNLLIPKKKMNIFLISKKINVFFFKMNLNVKKRSYNYSWYKSLDKKIINNSDIIICDNLPEVFKLKKKTILFANFFWHQILSIKLKKKKELDKLLKRKNSLIFCNYLFGNIEIKKRYSVKKVAFFNKFNGKKKKIIKNILISLGTANLDKKTKNFINNEINSFLKKIDHKRFNFYLDPSIKIHRVSNFKSKIFWANYSSKMYRKVDLSIVKPGLGTINDCLQYAIPIISYSKLFNKEFKFNSKILTDNKLGWSVKNFSSIPEKIDEIMKNKNLLNNYYLKCKKLKWGGENIFKREIKMVSI